MLNRILFIFLGYALGIAVQAQYAIPDPIFAYRLQQLVPNAMNGNVLDTNHMEVTSLTALSVYSAGISDLSGIQFFDALVVLDCNDNQLTSLPSLPASLRYLRCQNNQLTSLPSPPTALMLLYCHYNQLTSLPSLPSSLEVLYCINNQLTSLPSLPASLESLSCGLNQITELPSLPTSLEYLGCNGNQLTNLPSLPAGLDQLDCSYNQLTSLPSLPISLRTLTCIVNQLTSLPPLPASLTLLMCEDNQLTSLPPLPAGLELLYCGSNQLTNLPSLPASMWDLRCWNNLLTSLPPLPTILETLNFNNNQITDLPSLPASLEYLYCGSNQLSSLPSLPATLRRFDCSDNQLTSLPSLPGPLTYLNCANNQISCLPSLPNALEELRCQGNAIYCLPNFPVDIPPFYTGDYGSNLGFAPNLCSTSGPCFPASVIAGTIFNDANGNGLLDELEDPFMNGVAAAQPGNYLSGLDIQGNYALPVDPGSYTVQGQSVPYHTITTTAHTANITLGTSDTANHIGYRSIPEVYDLVVDIQSNPTRPGFDNNVWLEVKNIGTESTTATIDLDFDTDQSFVSSSIAPMTQLGTNANWTFPLDPGDTWNATVTLNTAATVPLGTAVEHLFTASPASADTTPANNSTAWNDEVVGSYDPNDKTASVSSLSPAQVLNGEWIEYLIRFQNTGTFMAEDVRITDVLSTDLQPGSFSYICASHENYWYLSHGTLVFQFDHIQLPDSNSNEPDSHGFVKFRIKPNPNLTLGEQVVNVANIYFDYNEPVITDSCIVLVDLISGIGEMTANEVLIYPNPTKDELNIVSDQMVESFQLFSSDGRLMQSGSVNAATHRIQLSGIECGLYVLELWTANGRFVERFVIED